MQMIILSLDDLLKVFPVPPSRVTLGIPVSELRSLEWQHGRQQQIRIAQVRDAHHRASRRRTPRLFSRAGISSLQPITIIDREKEKENFAH